MKMFGKWRNEPESVPQEEAAFAGDIAPAKAGQPLIGEGRKILVVDDNKVVLKAFELKMKNLGFTVLTALDGPAAVSCARHEKPDVIVLDINFPPDVGSTGLQWDGFTILLWMRRFQDAANIPVIIITSGDPSKFKDKAMTAGAVAFFQKPIDNEDFIMALRRVVGQPVKNSKAA
ncbi:MAG TPA: response regulator [Verrucomicrobiae bacterium]|jgi:CheY-like chemotaxis protein|nr:response regulator [Verrucomicrobiae bacterium]